MRPSRLFIPIASIVLFAACSPAAHPTQSPAIPTPSSVGSEIAGGLTLAPIQTPTPESAFPLPQRLPTWLSDPETGALAIVTGGRQAYPPGYIKELQPGETYQVSFVNTTTLEQVDLTVPAAQCMFWLDSHTFGLLSWDGQTMYAIDFEGRVAESEPFDPEKVRLFRVTQVSGAPSSYEIAAMIPCVSRSTEAEEGRMTLVGIRDDYSSDYSLYTTPGSEPLRVYNVATGQEVWASNPDDNFGEVDFAWSPVEPGELAVVQGIFPEGTRAGVHVERVFILDVTTGEELASYPGDFYYINWSPEGGRILFQPIDLAPQAVPHGEPPCVLDLQTGMSGCLQDIPRTHFPLDAELVGEDLSDFQWDEDGAGFYYRYEVIDITEYDQPVDRTGICRYDLEGGSLTCPTEEVAELEGAWIYWFELSPDGRSILIEFAGDRLRYGVLNLETRRFLELPFPSLDYRDGEIPNHLWRR